MKIELTKWNIDRVSKVLNEKIKGEIISIDGTLITGAIEAKIEFCEVDIPLEQRDSGEEDYIEIALLFEGGNVTKDFYPDREVCEIVFDVDGGITFRVEDIKKYVEREISYLQDRLKDYEEYMSR